MSNLPAIDLLNRNRQAIESLCRKYGVSRLQVFGSAVRPDWKSGASDLDLLAEFHEPPPGVNAFRQFFCLKADLEELLSVEVDLVDWKVAKDPIFIRSASESAVTWYAA
jgi:hypothetical protein